MVSDINLLPYSEYFLNNLTVMIDFFAKYMW